MYTYHFHYDKVIFAGDFNADVLRELHTNNVKSEILEFCGSVQPFNPL